MLNDLHSLPTFCKFVLYRQIVLLAILRFISIVIYIFAHI